MDTVHQETPSGKAANEAKVRLFGITVVSTFILEIAAVSPCPIGSIVVLKFSPPTAHSYAPKTQSPLGFSWGSGVQAGVQLTISTTRRRHV